VSAATPSLGSVVLRNNMVIAHICPSHELPPAPPASQQIGAGVGPAFSEAVNEASDVDEHPGSALERELGEKTRV
jgi:hypothetical protein